VGIGLLPYRRGGDGVVPQLGPTDDRAADPDLEALEALDEGEPMPDDDRPVPEDVNELVPDDARGEDHSP
jgi:hypothetical protein